VTPVCIGYAECSVLSDESQFVEPRLLVFGKAGVLLESLMFGYADTLLMTIPTSKGVFARSEFMRWMCWVSAFLLVCGTIGRAGACDCDKNRTVLPAVAPPSYTVLSSEACCAPGGFIATPGCCDYSRPCCTNAWAGFCVRKSMRCDPCRCGAGFPRGAYYGGSWCDSGCFRWDSGCCQSQAVPGTIETQMIEPAPASQTPAPTPAPAPEKSGQRPRTTFSYVK
jgi:hypothetical protein